MPDQYTSWTTAKVKKALGKETYKDAEGKTHTRRTGEQEVDYTYPVIDKTKITEPSDLVWAVEEIIGANQAGFQSLSVIVDHLNYGLYNDNRASLSSGRDVRYSAHQRQAIKMYGEMHLKFGLPLETAVEQLQRQGISDAEAVMQAFVSTNGQNVEEEVPANA